MSIQKLEVSEITERLVQHPGWRLEGEAIVKTFLFQNYVETLRFVNAVAEIAVREDHHPLIEFGYKTCRVAYATHSVQGISQKDFDCAQKTDSLVSAS